MAEDAAAAQATAARPLSRRQSQIDLPIVVPRLIMSARDGDFVLFHGHFDGNHDKINHVWDGSTALIEAVRAGNVDVAALILSIDQVDISVKDRDGLTALDYVDRKDLALLMLRHATCPAPSPDRALQLACIVGDVEHLPRILEESYVNAADVAEPTALAARPARFSKDYSGRHSLHLAAKEGHVVVVKLLVESWGFLVNQEDALGRTPLIYACIGNHADVIRYMLTCESIDVTPHDNEGRTALMYAKSYETMQLLLPLPDISVTEPVGATKQLPLTYAAARGYAGAVRALLQDERVKPVINGDDSDSPLLAAVEANHTQVVAELLDHHGVDVNKAFRVRDSSVLVTPLSRACSLGLHRIARLLLLSDGINVNGVQVDGHPAWPTPLALAVAPRTTGTDIVTSSLPADDVNHAEVVKLLLQNPQTNIFQKQDERDNAPTALALSVPSTAPMLMTAPQFHRGTMLHGGYLYYRRPRQLLRVRHDIGAGLDGDAARKGSRASRHGSVSAMAADHAPMRAAAVPVVDSAPEIVVDWLGIGRRQFMASFSVCGPSDDVKILIVNYTRQALEVYPLTWAMRSSAVHGVRGLPLGHKDADVVLLPTPPTFLRVLDKRVFLGLTDGRILAWDTTGPITTATMQVFAKAFVPAAARKTSEAETAEFGGTTCAHAPSPGRLLVGYAHGHVVLYDTSDGAVLGTWTSDWVPTAVAKLGEEISRSGFVVISHLPYPPPGEARTVMRTAHLTLTAPRRTTPLRRRSSVPQQQRRRGSSQARLGASGGVGSSDGSNSSNLQYPTPSTVELHAHTAVAVANSRKDVFVSGCLTGRIDVYQLGDLEEAPEHFKGHKRIVTDMHVVAEAERLYSSGVDDSPQWWDLAKHAPAGGIDNFNLRSKAIQRRATWVVWFSISAIVVEFCQMVSLPFLDEQLRESLTMQSASLAIPFRVVMLDPGWLTPNPRWLMLSFWLAVALALIHVVIFHLRDWLVLHRLRPRRNMPPWASFGLECQVAWLPCWLACLPCVWRGNTITAADIENQRTESVTAAYWDTIGQVIDAAADAVSWVVSVLLMLPLLRCLVLVVSCSDGALAFAPNVACSLSDSTWLTMLVAAALVWMLWAPALWRLANVNYDLHFCPSASEQSLVTRGVVPGFHLGSFLMHMLRDYFEWPVDDDLDRPNSHVFSMATTKFSATILAYKALSVLLMFVVPLSRPVAVLLVLATAVALMLALYRVRPHYTARVNSLRAAFAAAVVWTYIAAFLASVLPSSPVPSAVFWYGLLPAAFLGFAAMQRYQFRHPPQAFGYQVEGEDDISPITGVHQGHVANIAGVRSGSVEHKVLADVKALLEPGSAPQQDGFDSFRRLELERRNGSSTPYASGLLALTHEIDEAKRGGSTR